MPSQTSEFSKALVNTIKKEGGLAGRALGTATENALAAARGNDKPTFSLPQGTIATKLEGEQFNAAVPPYYLAVPLNQHGTSWRVPQEGFEVVKFTNPRDIPLLRPVLCVAVEPDSFHPTAANVTINVFQAGWDPHHPAILYQIGEKHPVFSLSRKIQNTLTAGEFLDLVADSSKWPNTQGSSTEIIPWPAHSGISTIDLYQGMRDLTQQSVSLRRFWKNIEARQVLSSSLVMGDHQLLAAAIWSLLDVEQQNKGDFVKKKNELTTLLKTGKITDWDEYAQNVLGIFAEVNYPVTLSIGWTGLQMLVNQVMDWSLIREDEQKKIVAQLMGIPDPKSLNMIRGFNSDPVGLLVSSPQWVGGMTVLIRDLIGMAQKTTDIKGDAARTLMQAEQEYAHLGQYMADQLLSDLRKAYPRMRGIAATIARSKIDELEHEMKEKTASNEPLTPAPPAVIHLPSSNNPHS